MSCNGKCGKAFAEQERREAAEAALAESQARVAVLKNALGSECTCGYCEEHQQQACMGCKCGYEKLKKDALALTPEAEKKP